mgnify:CR=1 FL=1
MGFCYFYRQSIILINSLKESLPGSSSRGTDSPVKADVSTTELSYCVLTLISIQLAKLLY